MKILSVNFGRVRTPIDEEHKQTGDYISIDWKTISSKIDIRLFSSACGDPLFEEVGSKSYSVQPNQEKK